MLIVRVDCILLSLFLSSSLLLHIFSETDSMEEKGQTTDVDASIAESKLVRKINWTTMSLLSAIQSVQVQTVYMFGGVITCLKATSLAY